MKLTGSRRFLAILFFATSGLIFGGPAYATHVRMGLRYERAANFIGGLEQIAITANFELPLKWHPFDSLPTSYFLETGGGVFLNGSPDARPFVELGPTVRFQSSRDKGWYIDFGVSPTLMGGSEFRDDRTLGGSFFFTTHLTAGWNFGTWQLGMRYQHISNANLSDPNPGVNTFGIQVTF